MDVQLDIQTGDLALEAGDAILVSGAAAVAQQLQIRLRLYRGEWTFDTRVGMPYWQQILGKGAPLPVIRQIFRQAVQTTPGIASVDRLDLDYEAGTRRLSVSLRATTTTGEPVEFTEFIG